MNPGDVFWYQFPEPEAGQKVMALPHMVVLVSGLGIHDTINACPISSAKNYKPELESSHPSVILLSEQDYNFLQVESVILADQIFCLSPNKLSSLNPIGFLRPEDLDELRGAIYDFLQLG